MTPKEGWVCPKCGRVYNPTVVLECWNCNNPPSSAPSIESKVSIKEVLDKTRNDK